MFFIVIFAALIIAILGVFFVDYFYDRQKNKDKEINGNLNRLSYTVLYIAGLPLIVFLPLIYLFFQYEISDVELENFTNKGGLGNVIGGMATPFIAITGVIITGLAFYMQYRANRLQVNIFNQQNEATKKQFEEEQKELKRQFDIQLSKQTDEIKRSQFESQFFELLRLHKENINEMVIQGYFFDNNNKVERDIKGRKIFVTNLIEFNSLINIIYEYNTNILCHCNEYITDNKEIISIAYNVFFFGLDACQKQLDNKINPINKKHLSKELETWFKGLFKYFKDARGNHENGNRNVKVSTSIELNFKYKPYSGHLSKYGHYYRNLILIVKHVVNNNALSYVEKRNYLRILRAQLTSYEQFLIFLNWYTEVGIQWEGMQNKFLTDYRMIHNINVDTIIKNDFIDWEHIIKDTFLEYTNFQYINTDDKELFEVIKGIETNRLTASN